MEVSLWRDLLCSINSFFCLSTRDCFGLEPVWKNYHATKETLELLKPTIESIVHTNLSTNDALSMELEQLVQSINKWRDLFENWHLLSSRVHQAVKAEVSMIKTRRSVVKIVRLLKDPCQYLAAELSLPAFEVNSKEVESTSAIIKETIQKGLRNPKKLEEFVQWLGFNSNLEILVEAVALEKLKNSGQTRDSAELQYIEQLIALLMHKHDQLSILKQSQSSLIIPHDFCCPLSLELMVNPVILASGQTYEHAYIRRWFDMGLTVCPKTRQALHHTEMIPNYTSKALILNWCEINNMKLPDPMNSINEPFYLFYRAGLLDSVRETKQSAEKLKFDSLNTQKESYEPLGLFFRACLLDPKGEMEDSVEGLKSDSMNNQRKATAQLLLFAKQNMENRILIAEYGGIRLLANLLHSIDPEIQQNAVTTLLYLAVNHDNKIAIANSDAIGPLIHVLQTGTSEARENSAATLFCLSMIHENKSRIGKLGAIGPLFQLLRNGTSRGKNHAAMALFNLSIDYENRVGIANYTGGVSFIVELSKDPVAGMVDKAVAILESLSRVPEGRAAISQAGGLPVLVEVLELGSARQKENAVAALLRLCVYSSRVCRTVLVEGAEPPLLALALSGTPRAREKALALHHYLRRLH